MKKKYNFGSIIINIIQGAIVGISAILPGISGGVLCVAFGIYEPMMELLTAPKSNFKKHIPTFAPFVLGWAVGFVVFSKILGVFLGKYADISAMLFFGLVCGTIPQLMKTSELSGKEKSWTPFVISLAISYTLFHIMSLLEGNGGGVYAPQNFFTFTFCGFMWGISLIVPGMSSSPVLQYLNLLEPLSVGIGSFDLMVLIPFCLGIILTVLVFAKLVNMLFKKHYALISRIILGFVISSSLKTLPTNFSGTWSLVISIICCALGFAVAYFMDRSEAEHK